MIEFHYPRRLVYGAGSLAKMAGDIAALGLKRVFILTILPVKEHISQAFDAWATQHISLKFNCDIKSEPGFADVDAILKEARDFEADGIMGIGGGSIMDVAKLVAVQLHASHPIHAIVGNGLIKGRTTYLACIPTTSGTGSEVSPNAIFIDDTDGAKKGIISPYLVPDAAYIDPALTLGVPPYVTAYTGMDALTHCIEAYANRFAHPMTDVLALEGIRLIGGHLKEAVNDGQNMEARSKVALGSLYGGMCLGPVNTAAVHALAYPLGSDFKIAHGVSNALLLPYVMEYNLSAAPKRYAEIAMALGVTPGASNEKTAQRGISVIRNILGYCGLPVNISDLGIPVTAIEGLAKSAIQIQRLLKNNVREITENDAIAIYQSAYANKNAKAR